MFVLKITIFLYFILEGTWMPIQEEGYKFRKGYALSVFVTWTSLLYFELKRESKCETDLRKWDLCRWWKLVTLILHYQEFGVFCADQLHLVTDLWGTLSFVSFLFLVLKCPTTQVNWMISFISGRYREGKGEKIGLVSFYIWILAKCFV